MNIIVVAYKHSICLSRGHNVLVFLVLGPHNVLVFLVLGLFVEPSFPCQFLTPCDQLR